MNTQQGVRWLTQSRRRLRVTVALVASVLTVVGMTVLVIKFSQFTDAVASVQPTKAATVAVDEYFDETAPPMPTFSPEGEPYDPLQERAAEIAAGDVVAAWLAGDPDLAGLAHPDLLAAVPVPPPGLIITSPPVVVSTDDLEVTVEVGTTGGDLVLTMLRTDEVGWVATAMGMP